MEFPNRSEQKQKETVYKLAGSNSHVVGILHFYLSLRQT